jgi:hypothetical protein
MMLLQRMRPPLPSRFLQLSLLILMIVTTAAAAAAAAAAATTTTNTNFSTTKNSNNSNNNSSHPWKNPYVHGCLYEHGLVSRIRVCHSEDILPDAIQQGHCRSSSDTMDYMEIRIQAEDWESIVYEAWILQVVLSELLDVPTTIETGSFDGSLNFYHPEAPLQYGSTVLDTTFDAALHQAYAVQDCRRLGQQQQQHNQEYIPCAHILPERWKGTRQKRRLVLSLSLNIESHSVSLSLPLFIYICICIYIYWQVSKRGIRYTTWSIRGKLNHPKRWVYWDKKHGSSPNSPSWMIHPWRFI